MRIPWKRLAAPILLMGVVLLATAVPALADAPANDTEDGAIVVDALPFVHSMDSSEANGDGPRFCSNNGSVFYRFTPSADVRIQVDTIGSQLDTVLAVYTRDSAGAAAPAACNYDRFGYASGVRVHARAGETYFIMVARCCGRGSDGGGPLTITVGEVTDLQLQVTMDLTLPPTVDLATGIATVSGSATCNKRSVIYPEGLLRQLRDGLWIARGWYGASVSCLPGEPVAWSVEIDSETMVAFDPGSATIRTWDDASDGFREWVDFGMVDLKVQLASG